MSSRSVAKKLILIGLDAIEAHLITKFVNEGKMPNTASLLKNGIFSLAYPSPPCDTPTNWTTIVTGAWTGTHCMTSFFAHIPRAELNVGYRTLNSKVCKAEFLWNVLEEAGKKCVIVNYPVAWPPTIRKGIVLGGPAPGASPWRVKWPSLFLSKDIYEALPPSERMNCIPVEFVEAKEWTSLPKSYSAPLEAAIWFAGEAPLERKAPGWQVRPGEKLIEAPPYHLLLLDTSGEGYDTLIICKDKNLPDSEIARLKVGEWSDWITETVKVRGEEREVIFRFKLVKLSADAREFKLYRTDVFLVEGWSFPDNVAKEIVAHVGPYIEGYEGHVSSVLHWFEEEYYSPTWLEHIEQSVDWYSGVAKYLKEKYSWDVFIMHYHLHDSLNHKYLGLLYEEHPDYKPDIAKTLWRFYEECYSLTDQLIGNIVDACADEDTLVVLVSDHGAVPAWKFVWIGGALIRHGLLSYKWSAKDYAYIVDWSKTSAYPFGHTTPYIWVNLKGRDPHGIVDPKDYRRVQEDVIEALYSIRDPETNECPIALALRKEEADIFGQWGDQVGDVIYFPKPGYTNVCFDFSKVPPKIMEGKEVRPLKEIGFWTALHHDYLPNAKLGLFTNSAFVIMAGPGVKKGYRRDKPIWLVDLVPTICWLMGIRTPKNCEGKLVLDLLEE